MPRIRPVTQVFDRIGATIAGLGDSHIQGNGSGAQVPTGSDWTTTKNYPLGGTLYGWSVLLSQGRAVSVGNYGVGGQTATQIAARMPDVIASGAKTCVVIAGTNDALQTVPLATTTAAIASIITGLRAGGVEPILLTVPPNGGTAAVKDAVDRINAWLRTYALRQRVRLVDIHAALADPATRGYAAGFDFGDGTHMSQAAAATAGGLIAAAMGERFAPVGGWLATSNTDATNLLTNALGLTDATADGIPDGWTALGAATGGTVTNTLETVTGWAGKAFAVQQAANTNTRQLFQNVAAGANTFAVGDRMRFALRAKTDGLRMYARPQFTGATGTTQCQVLDIAAVTDGVLALQEFTVPAGTTALACYLGATAGTGKVHFGQPTLVNLTKLGF